MSRPPAPEVNALPGLPLGWKWRRNINCWAAEFHWKHVSIENGALVIRGARTITRETQIPISVALAVIAANNHSLTS